MLLALVLLAAGGAVCGVPGSRPPMRWREGVQSRVLGPAGAGSSARGGSVAPLLPAHACGDTTQRDRRARAEAACR